MNCKNCHHTVDQNFCAHCGQAVSLKRVDRHYILHEVWHILHFEKGVFFTIKELLIRPGQNVREFVIENRSRLVKPIIFIIITSLIYTIINNLFHIEEGYVTYHEAKASMTGVIFAWIQHHYGYANILIGVFIAFWTKLFFRKYDYNFFEVLILLCFVMGIGMLIFSVFALVKGLTKWDVMGIAGMLMLIYCSWGIGQFFNQQKMSSYLKAFAAYIVGMLTFLISMLLLGVLIDVIKHAAA